MTDTVEELQSTIEELRKELARYQWKDIETAPKDESIIIFHPEGGVCEGWYETKNDRWYVLDGRNLKEYIYYYSDVREDLPCLTYLMSPPTRWMPLPEPPQ